MRFDVPFIPDSDYARFLFEHRQSLESVHFGLQSPHVADARNVMEPKELDEIISALQLLGGVPRYLLVNARIQDPDRYFDQEHLKRATSAMARLTQEAGLTGIVFADAYYLNALSKAAPEVAAQLEAVPSVNCMIDSWSRAEAYLRVVRSSKFRLPSRLVLDRGLNRDPDKLRAVVKAIRKRWPGLRFMLLANEGCLPDCPFKPAHDAHLALARMPGCPDRTFAMNRELGCVSSFLREPWRLFSSPFIRPEDTHRYEGVVDGIKLCGRERGGRAYLERVVEAYVQGVFKGNLLTLMDTLGEFENRWEVLNHLLPEDFSDRVRVSEACDEEPLYEDLGQFVTRTKMELRDLRKGEG